MNFIGRSYELARLHKLYKEPKSHIAVVYGRRRIGKSLLVDTFRNGLPSIKLEGLEGERTAAQIKQATKSLAAQLDDPLLAQVNFQAWTDLFDYLTRYIENQKNKVIIFLDELQWLAANQTALISLIKMYWDNYWKKESVLLILCGSVSSYMVKRVVKSKALYGRIDFELPLGPLEPREALTMLGGKRSRDEIFQYLLVLGGIPKYLEMVNPNRSFMQNMDELFFKKASYFSTEYEKIFYSQFREHLTYEKIVTLLTHCPSNLHDIGQKLSIPSGGGLKLYLDNLEKSQFISSYSPFDKNQHRLKKYQLTDEFLRFFFKYVKPNLKAINTNTKRNLFTELVLPKWLPWTGLAFENFCLKNATVIADKLGFSSQVVNYGPYFKRGDKGFQIDLVYLRLDRTVSICEIKYYDQEIEPSIISELEKKCALLTIPRGYTLERCLISRFGPSRALKAAGYFHHTLDVDDFFH